MRLQSLACWGRVGGYQAGSAPALPLFVFDRKVVDLLTDATVMTRWLVAPVGAVLGRHLKCRCLLFMWLLAQLASVPAARQSATAQLDAAQEALRRGQADACIDLVEKAMKGRPLDSRWSLVLAEAHVQRGRFGEAQQLLEEVSDFYTMSLSLKWALHELYRQTGQADRLAQIRNDLRLLMARRQSWPWSPDELVVLGRFALAEGNDPKQVLTFFYDRALLEDPRCRRAYWAKGELAIEKGDFVLAARAYRAGLEKFPDDPDGLAGLALSLFGGDREASVEQAQKAVTINPGHPPSLLLLAEHHIDAEAYAKAHEALDPLLKVDPGHPLAWAFKAVLAHLDNDASLEQEARSLGLKRWATNPQVDHWIGKKLSDKYRFKEGAAAQKRAMAMDPSYLPAQLQLAQDMLRLGDNDRGYRLAEVVLDRDPYNTLAYNLVELRDNVAGYTTLVVPGFVVKMNPLEAEVYGPSALAVLQDAQRRLVDKYGVNIDRPTLVEIFADQRDFAIRTFGLPGGVGYLGVCFGDVITANSPATGTTGRTNWQAVLFHEYCHVVTLNQTNNKMPRWLSEGLSVYEERQANPAWGQGMNPVYRERILSEDGLTPLADMSSAFMNPSGPGGIGFAYYQSNLAVAYLIDAFGFEPMRELLNDLGRGEPINDAMVSRFGTLSKIEQGFVAFAQNEARAFGPSLDWQPPEPPEALEASGTSALPAANSAWGLQNLGKIQMDAQQYEDAEKTFETLVEACPQWVGDDAPYRPLVKAQLALDKKDAAYETLKTWTAMDAEALDGFETLLAMAEAREDWLIASQAIDRGLGVQPMLPVWHAARARVAEHLDQKELGVAAYRSLLKMNPTDPVGVRYELARMLHVQSTADAVAEARALMIDALALAPRFRAGHRLLLQIVAWQEAQVQLEPQSQAKPEAQPGVRTPQDLPANEPLETNPAPRTEGL